MSVTPTEGDRLCIILGEQSSLLCTDAELEPLSSEQRNRSPSVPPQVAATNGALRKHSPQAFGISIAPDISDRGRLQPQTWGSAQDNVAEVSSCGMSGLPVCRLAHTQQDALQEADSTVSGDVDEPEPVPHRCRGKARLSSYHRQQIRPCQLRASPDALCSLCRSSTARQTSQ